MRSQGFSTSFILYIASRAASGVALQMTGVAVGWHIYAMTGRAFDLGLVGLVQFLPAILLVLFVGHAADRYNRRLIVGMAQACMALILALISLGAGFHWIARESLLSLLFLFGVARTFEFTTAQTIIPSLVDQELLPRALALGSSVRQAAIIAGPVLGGFLYLLGSAVVYGVSAMLFLASAILIARLRLVRRVQPREAISLFSIFGGIAYIRSQPVVLGAISLDLFAVLLGGATALLPIYARDILHAGPSGLGCLRAAPALGTLVSSLHLARFPLRRHVGKVMFSAVALFGAATIIFALSRSMPLSFLSLMVLGGADMISVVIRASLVQLETPDEMRGRVSAVNAIFIGSSNELGEFESGLAAAWFGVIPAAVLGGVGTLFVVLLWMGMFPQLLQRQQLRS
jgi:predicted MFS family arabinose efflux permease